MTVPAGHASGRDQPRLITWKRPALSNLPCWKVLGSAVLAVLSCLPAACDTIRAMDSKRAAKPSVSAPPDRPQMSSGHHVRTRLGGAPPTFFGGSTVERASSRSAGGPYCPMHGHVKVLQPRSGALEQITDALRCKQRRRGRVAELGQSSCIRRVHACRNFAVKADGFCGRRRMVHG